MRGEATARRVTGGRELPCDPAPAVHGSMILSGPAPGAAPATPAPAAAANPDCPLHCCHRSCLALAPWPPALPRRPRPPRTAGATTARTPHLVRFTSRCLPCHLLADTRHCSAAAARQIISHLAGGRALVRGGRAELGSSCKVSGSLGSTGAGLERPTTGVWAAPVQPPTHTGTAFLCPPLKRSSWGL